MARCFIAITIPQVLRKKIKEAQEEIAKLPISCKLVEEENLHVSLSFLGEVEEDKINGIWKTLDEICRGYQNFEVFVSGIKPIPSESYIRVLALDVFDKNGEMKRIGKEIKEKIGGDVKPPHLTLCRVKSIREKEVVVKKIREMGLMGFDERFPVIEIVLMKSELRGKGPVYSAIHSSALA